MPLRHHALRTPQNPFAGIGGGTKITSLQDAVTFAAADAAKRVMYSRHHAQRCSCNTVLDPFAGVGGNVIQMAATCRRVIAGELSPDRASLIRHNAQVQDRNIAMFRSSSQRHLLPHDCRGPAA